jgi:Abnormal spindle-like microcephaly-assoc'd, ASPM-SPD-2-Hydin
VSKLNACGSALLYSTHLGEFTFPTGIVGDTNGRAYVAGEVVVNSTPPGAIPLASPIQSSFGAGLSHGFVSVLNNLGTALVFSSYLGGDFASVAGLSIDSATNIYLTGAATGPFPILNAPNGVYLPLVAQSIPRGSFSPASQGFALKISLLTGTSLSHPTTVDFRPDPMPVGSSANATVLLANTSASGNVTISHIAITGDYSQTNNCPQTLLPATSCKVQVTFTPTAQGNGTGSITVTDTAPGSPHVIGLIGSGLLPQVGRAPTSPTFASQVVGTSNTTQVVTLTNTGGANLTISNVATTGDFSESNDCGVLLPASAPCQISVSFSPTLVGNRTGTLSIIDSAAGSLHTVALSGTGVGPNLGLAVSPGGTNTMTVVAGQPATYTLLSVAAELAGPLR